MRLYRIHYFDSSAGDGSIQEWFTSKAEARKRMRAIDAENEGTAEFQWFTDEPEAMQITPTRTGVIRFLNQWAG